MRALALGVVAAIAVSSMAGVYGYRAGQDASDAAYNAALLAEVEAGQKLEEERRRLAIERDELLKHLEEEAHADPVIVDRCLSPDRVRRLNTIR